MFIRVRRVGNFHSQFPFHTDINNINDDGENTDRPHVGWEDSSLKSSVESISSVFAREIPNASQPVY